MKATEEQKLAMKKYSKRPEVKAKKKEYMRNYRINYEAKNKELIAKRKREYYLKNKQLIDARNKEWHKNNKDKFRAYRKIYDLANKEKMLKTSSDWYYAQDRDEYRRKKRIWENNALKTNINYLIKKRSRIRIIQAFNSYTKTGKIKPADEYGINYNLIIEKLISTLPKDFKDKKYVVDHIKPCCSFDLTNPEEVKKCFSPDNLRWLTWEENSHKVKEDLKQSIH